MEKFVQSRESDLTYLFIDFPKKLIKVKIVSKTTVNGKSCNKLFFPLGPYWSWGLLSFITLQFTPFIFITKLYFKLCSLI